MFPRSWLSRLLFAAVFGLCCPVTTYGYFDGVMAFVQRGRENDTDCWYEEQLAEARGEMNPAEYRELVYQAEARLANAPYANFGEVMRTVCEIQQEEEQTETVVVIENDLPAFPLNPYAEEEEPAETINLNPEPPLPPCVSQERTTEEQIDILRKELREVREEVRTLHKLMKAMKTGPKQTDSGQDDIIIEAIHKFLSFGRSQKSNSDPKSPNNFPSCAVDSGPMPMFTIPSKEEPPRYRLVPVQEFHPGCTFEIRAPVERSSYRFTMPLPNDEVANTMLPRYPVYYLVPEEDCVRTHVRHGFMHSSTDPNVLGCGLSEVPWYSVGKLPAAKDHEQVFEFNIHSSR